MLCICSFFSYFCVMRFGFSNILRAIVVAIILVIIFVVPRVKANYHDTTNLAKMPNQVCHDTLHVIAPRTMRVIPIWLACHLDLFEKQGLYVNLDIAKDRMTCDSIAMKYKAAIVITDESEGYFLPGYTLSFPHFLCEDDFLSPQRHFSRNVFFETYNESIKYMYSHYAEKWGYDAFKALSVPKSLYNKVSIPHFDYLSLDRSSW